MIPVVDKKRRVRRRHRIDSGKRAHGKIINWLLEFMRTDVRRLKRSEFRKLHYQVLKFLYGGQMEDKEELRYVATDTELNRQALIKIQEILYSSLDAILDQSRRSSEDGETRSNNLDEVLYDYRVKRDTVTLVPRRRTHPHVPANLTGTYKHTPLRTGRLVDEDYLRTHFWNNTSIDASRYAFFSRHYDPDIDSTVLLSLITLLEKFSLKSISKCDLCHAFFKRTAKKEWDLCRPCVTRITTDRWRTDNREVYNEYQLNLAKGLKGETPTQIRDRLMGEKKRGEKAEPVKQA
jgi:hypothetical protein